MRVGRNDVAREAGVSPTTVSFVLNHKDKHISAETKKRVREVAKKLGYVPNRIAQALKTGKTKIITLWVYSFKDIYANAIISNINEEIRKYDYELLIREIKSDKIIEEIYSDGIIAFDCPNYIEKYVEKFDETIPIVSAGLHYSSKYDNVIIDFTNGVEEALNKFLSLGCKNIGALLSKNNEEPREKVYNKFIKDNNLTNYLYEIKDQFDTENIFDELKKCDYLKDLDAIYCFNDNVGVKLLAYLNSIGINVPNDIKVISNDNLELCKYSIPSLSSVDIPIKLICETCVKFLMNRLKNPNMQIQAKTYYSKLVERNSCS